MVVLVHDCAAAPARDQPAVHGVRGDAGHRQALNARLSQNRVLPERRVHRSGHREHDGVVDDLHDGDRGGVRRQRQRRPAAGRALTAERHAGQRVTEKEARAIGQEDGGQVVSRARCR